MSNIKKRMKRYKEKKDSKKVPEVDDYNTFRMLLFQTAEGIREVIKEEGFEVGEVKDCAPLFQFKCTRCKSDKIAAYVFTNTVALACMNCNAMEVVGSGEKVK